jgi:hypothetical protein
VLEELVSGLQGCQTQPRSMAESLARMKDALDQGKPRAHPSCQVAGSGFSCPFLSLASQLLSSSRSIGTAQHIDRATTTAAGGSLSGPAASSN